jgi:16S rRNA G966 N2-methylase RsmD
VSKLITADAKNLPTIDKKCHVAFIDLPYFVRDVEKILEQLIQKEWLHEESLVIVEIQKTYDLNLTNDWKEITRRIYNKTKIIYLSLNNTQS